MSQRKKPGPLSNHLQEFQAGLASGLLHTCWVGSTVQSTGDDLPQLHILACVGLIRLLYVCEFKVKGMRLGDLSRPSQVLHQRHKLMVVPTVIVEFWRESSESSYQTTGSKAASMRLLED